MKASLTIHGCWFGNKIIVGFLTEVKGDSEIKEVGLKINNDSINKIKCNNLWFRFLGAKYG